MTKGKTKKSKKENHYKLKARTKELFNISKEYHCLWYDKDNNIRYNTMYGHMMRYVFNAYRVRCEIFIPASTKASYWRMVNSYNIKDITDGQWRRALNYISCTYS